MEEKTFYTLYNKKNNEIPTGIYEEKKSKFICYIFNISNEDEAKQYVADIQKENKTARHVVYIYSVKDKNNLVIRFSDDGEPQGTGTRAIYETLQKESITNICVIIVRYFGGILLGAGPLSRAYLKAYQIANKECRREEIFDYIKYSFIVNYSNFDAVERLINKYLSNNDIKNINKEFNDNIKISLQIKEILIEDFKNEISKYM